MRERERDVGGRVERLGESGRQLREKKNKIIFLVLQLSYSAILHLESHCSTLANFFAIVYIYKFGCSGGFLVFYAKLNQRMTYTIPNVNALSMTLFLKIILTY